MHLSGGVRRWAVRRGQIAQLVRALRSHRRGRGFESLSAHQRENPSGARVLSREIPVVLAAAKGQDEELWPEELFLTPNASVGHINTAVDGDGVVRRIPMEVQTSRGSLKAFSWQVAALAHPRRSEPLPLPPLDAGGRFFINYRPSQVNGSL